MVDIYELVPGGQPDELVTDPIMKRLIDGERVVVTDAWLDSIVDHPMSNHVATCLNRRQVGTLDRYVAWITTAPADIEYRDGYAIGST